MFGAVVPVAAESTPGTVPRLGAGPPRTWHSPAVVVFAFAATVLLVWPLWAVLLVAAPASVALARRRPHGGAEGPGAGSRP